MYDEGILQRIRVLRNKINELRIEQHLSPNKFWKLEHKKRKLSDKSRRLRYKLNYE